VKTQDPVRKIKQKSDGVMTQVVEHLPRKHKTLSSNPSTEKKERERRKGGRNERRKEKSRVWTPGRVSWDLSTQPGGNSWWLMCVSHPGNKTQARFAVMGEQSPS
jgi:hypothetical protein